MSQSNLRPETVFRPSLRDWQAAFRARRAERAQVLGEETAAPAAPIREKKMSNRKRRTAKTI